MEAVVKHDILRETFVYYQKTGKNAEGDPSYANSVNFLGFGVKSFQWIHNESGERVLSSARIYTDDTSLSFNSGDSIAFSGTTHKHRILNKTVYNNPDGSVNLMVIYVL